MDLEKICGSIGHGMDGYAVFYGQEGSYKSNRIRNTKRLVKFVNNLHNRNIKFRIFSCNTEKELSESRIHKILNIGKIKENVLVLDG